MALRTIGDTHFTIDLENQLIERFQARDIVIVDRGSAAGEEQEEIPPAWLNRAEQMQADYLLVSQLVYLDTEEKTVGERLYEVHQANLVFTCYRVAPHEKIDSETSAVSYTFMTAHDRAREHAELYASHLLRLLAGR